MRESVRAELEILGPGGAGCLLVRRGGTLHPAPLPRDRSTVPAATLPASCLVDVQAASPGGPAFLIVEPRVLQRVRALIWAGARGAVLCPVPPPSPSGTHESFLLVWFDGSVDSEQEAERVRHAASDLAVRIPALLAEQAPVARSEADALTKALARSTQGIIVIRPGGAAIWSNRAGERAVGLEHPLVPGDSLFGKLPEPARLRLESLIEVSASGAWASEEVDFGPKGEEPKTQHVIVDAVTYDDGPACVIALRGLTERDRLVDLLRREKDFTRSLLEAANACVLGLDLQGRTILFNRVFQDVSDYRLADVLGRDAMEILVPEPGRADWRDAHLRALSGAVVTDRDFTLRTRSGERRILCLSAGRINDANGAARGVLWTGRDVTVERRREHDLRVREESTSRSLSQLKEFSRISSLILQEKNLDSVCRMFVEALSKVSTFRRAILTLCEDFRGYAWYFAGLSEEEQEIFHRNKMTQRERITIFQERFRLGNSYYIPHSEGWDYEGVRSHAGTEGMHDWHPDDFLFIPLYGANRKLVGVVSVDDPEDGRRPSAESISPLELFANQVAHSIEERKLDLEIRQSTERYRTLVETMHEGVFSVDLRERILMANATLARLVGIPEMLLNGRPIGSIMEPDDLARFRTGSALHEGGRVARFELFLRSESGERIPVMASVSPYMDEGKHMGCFAVVRDLRAEKQAEQERKTMQEQLAQAEKLSALGEVISGIAHELNNPLTGVMGYSQLLLKSEAAPEDRKNLEKIHKEAQRCEKIVKNLLIFARINVPERKAVRLNDLVGATLELRANQLKVDNIEVILDLEETLPEVTGDFHQLQQVVFNIVNNAQQAMMERGAGGRLTITTRSSDGFVEMSVSDTGPGIPPDRIQKIFDPFFTTKAIGKGTGLGLSLAYGIIKEHEGRIDVSSVPGRGATFTIHLPVRTEEEAAMTEVEHSKPSSRPAGGKEILVVDDEETILDLLESVLLSAGHRVTTACNGREALEKIRGCDFDVIISDVKMPDMGGERLYECITEIKPHLKTRMVFSTGDTVNPTTQALFQRTGNLHISKPFRLEEVDQVIRQILELHGEGSAGGTAS